MRSSTVIKTVLFTLFSVAALTAQAATETNPMPDVHRYHYGDRLDIKKVLSVQDDQRDACGIVNTRMDYLDSQGRKQSVTYLTYATNGCNEN